MRNYFNFKHPDTLLKISEKELREQHLICFEMELIDKKRNEKFKDLKKEDRQKITKQLKKIYKI